MAQLTILNALLLLAFLAVLTSDASADDNDSHQRNRRAWGLSTCARMNDGPVGAKAARGLCISSCKFQNAGTGYCVHRQNRPVCVCSRFGQGGGSWPNVPKLPSVPGRPGK